MSDKNVVAFDDAIGKVFRHKRLFNYVISPLSLDDEIVRCHVGKNLFKEFPVDYFKRDWVVDDNIDYKELLEKINSYSDETPFTTIYDSDYEIDDGKPHSYIHFNDDMAEKMIRFPKWHITTCTKEERKDRINPFTMIMPVQDGLEDTIQQELDMMNEIRDENEFIQLDDFQGFEFGLIKYLEKKYLRNV